MLGCASKSACEKGWIQNYFNTKVQFELIGGDANLYLNDGIDFKMAENFSKVISWEQHNYCDSLCRIQILFNHKCWGDWSHLGRVVVCWFLRHPLKPNLWLKQALCGRMNVRVNCSFSENVSSPLHFLQDAENKKSRILEVCSML